MRYAVWLIASAKFALPSALLVWMANSLGFNFSPLLSSTASPRDATVIYQLSAPIIQLNQSGTAPHGGRDGPQ